MSKNAGKIAATLLGKGPTQPINFRMLRHSGLLQFERDYIMVSVAAYRVYHYSRGDINAHYAEYLWHDNDNGDFICLLNDLDEAIIDLKNSPNYPHSPPGQMHLCPWLSNFVFSVIPQPSSNSDDEKMEDYYKRIELFLQRYMGSHWNQFMTEIVETNPPLQSYKHW